MSTLLWITIEMEYKIKCFKFILFFTNGRQKFDPERVNPLTVAGTLKRPRLKKIIKNRLLDNSVPIFCFCIPRMLL